MTPNCVRFFYTPVSGQRAKIPCGIKHKSPVNGQFHQIFTESSQQWDVENSLENIRIGQSGNIAWHWNAIQYDTDARQIVVCNASHSERCVIKAAKSVLRYHENGQLHFGSQIAREIIAPNR